MALAYLFIKATLCRHKDMAVSGKISALIKPVIVGQSSKHYLPLLGNILKLMRIYDDPKFFRLQKLSKKVWKPLAPDGPCVLSAGYFYYTFGVCLEILDKVSYIMMGKYHL